MTGTSATMTSLSTHRRIRAFTLVELLVVITVIAILLGLAIPSWLVVRSSLRKSAARSLVEAVAQAVVSYGRTAWQAPERSGGLVQVDPLTREVRMRSYVMWDWNQDQVLDGYPEQETGGWLADRNLIVASGYRGFQAMTGFPLRGKGGFDAVRGRLLDPWERPLRIAFAAKQYGGEDFGVWSTGPDGADDPAWPAVDDGLAPSAWADNLCSWKAP